MATVIERLRQLVELAEAASEVSPAVGGANEQGGDDEAKRIVQAVEFLGSTLREQSRTDERTGDALRVIGEWLLALAGQSASTPTASIQPASETLQSTAAPLPAVIAPVQRIPLSLGSAQLHVEVKGTDDEANAARRAAERSPAADVVVSSRPWTATEIDPVTIAIRARLKAEACDWALRRRRLVAEGADHRTMIRPTDEAIVSQARALPSCFLWAMDPSVNLPDDGELQDIAACYRNLATALELADRLAMDSERDQGMLHESYALLAESQSAVRAWLTRRLLQRDQDQIEVFNWLRSRTAEDRVLVQRYMKLEDPADPAAWADLAERLAMHQVRADELRAATQQRRRLLNKARYCAQRITADQAEAMNQWPTLVRTIDELASSGLPPSDPAIRDLLLPLVDTMPDELELPRSFDRVMEAIDQYLTSRELDQVPQPRTRGPSVEVQEVAGLLRNSVVVLIGGEPRVQSKIALERELGLRELRWISGSRHQSIHWFEPDVIRPETALVLLAIRWASHSYEGVKEFCARHDKPYVRLPGGYNPRQVAMQILAQVGDTLRAKRQRLGIEEAAPSGGA